MTVDAHWQNAKDKRRSLLSLAQRQIRSRLRVIPKLVLNILLKTTQESGEVAFQAQTESDPSDKSMLNFIPSVSFSSLHHDDKFHFISSLGVLREYCNPMFPPSSQTRLIQHVTAFFCISFHLYRSQSYKHELTYSFQQRARCVRS